MQALTSGTFRQAMLDHPMTVVVFAGGRAGGEAALAALRDPESSSGPWFWAWVDTSMSPETAGMFGIDSDRPTVLVMREEIVLYCEPFDPVDPGSTRRIIDRAAKLDMARIHSEMAEEQENLAALHARRACPTNWRR